VPKNDAACCVILLYLLQIRTNNFQGFCQGKQCLCGLAKGNIMEVVSMYRKILWSLALVALVMAGCAKKQIYSSNPSMQTVSTSIFEAKLEPLRAEGYGYYNRFRFEFTNKSSQDLVVSWEKSFFLHNGKRYGRFGWEGLTFEQLRGLQEEPDIKTAPGLTESRIIFPLKLMGWKEEGVRMKATTPEAGFTHGVIPEGENGVSLAVIQNGKLVRENILVQITMD